MFSKLRFKFLLLGQTFLERGAWFLAPFSWVWQGIVFCKNALYDRQWLPIARVNCPVISVGNIVAGGTGKTPFVHFLAKAFSHRKVAILSRGYGPIPDEALLLKRRLPKAKIYIGKDRCASAKKAVEEGAELLILDDGFQYRKLHRDFDIVLLSGKEKNFLPRGFLRDSPKRLSKADAIFAFDKDFELVVERILDSQENPIPSIRDWPVAIFSGIANPQTFKKTLLGLGAKICAEWILADHEKADAKRLSRFANRCKQLDIKALVCTEKDFVKLDRAFASSLPLLFLEVSLRIEEAKLIAKIDQTINHRPSWVKK